MKQIDRNQEQLLSLLGMALFDRVCRLPSDTDWRGVMQEAKSQAVLPLAFEAAKDQMPPDLRRELEPGVEDCLARNLCLDYDHVLLNQYMTEAEIPYVVLKGSASAAYYPNPVLRTMGDVDFLVRKEDVGRAAAVLEREGFCRAGDMDHAVHQTFLRKDDSLYDSEWELHWQPNGIPNNDTGEKIRALLADSVQTAQLRTTENGSYYVPDPFHHGLMILIHTVRHMLHTGVGLRHLCDWAVFAASFSEQRFRACFEETFRNLGLWDTAAALTAVSVRFLGCPDPHWQGAVDEELTDGLICDVLAGGNFGMKDRQRINASKLFVNSKDGTLRTGRGLENLISALNERSRRRFPIMKSLPVLLPFGWAWVGVRHLLRIARGKRPELQLDRMISEANRRSELYSQLRIYESGEE